jgi:hypothetical protein
MPIKGIGARIIYLLRNGLGYSVGKVLLPVADGVVTCGFIVAGLPRADNKKRRNSHKYSRFGSVGKQLPFSVTSKVLLTGKCVLP